MPLSCGKPDRRAGACCVVLRMATARPGRPPLPAQARGSLVRRHSSARLSDQTPCQGLPGTLQILMGSRWAGAPQQPVSVRGTHCLH